MCFEEKLRVIEKLDIQISKIDSVSYTRVEKVDQNGSLHVAIHLDAQHMAWNAKDLYVPKMGLSDLRLITNPVRRFFREREITCSITTPGRYYKARASCHREFLGYSSAKILLQVD